MPLRFPNPGSDMSRLIYIYRLVYAETRSLQSFDLDQMSSILTAHLQASSRGGVGAQALARSNQSDRSRDPLYNQSKSYSEVFRMLGWLRPAGHRLEFKPTLLGDLIAEDFANRDDLVSGLLRECLLAITFPNPATSNIGIVNHRPFRWLLLLTAQLGGKITRHEMILGLLAVTDDLQPKAFDAAVDRVKKIRGARSKVAAAIGQEASKDRIQVITLENYTRFPVGVLKSSNVGWGSSSRVTGLYEKPAEALVLTTLGLTTAEALKTMVDVRESSLTAYSMAERASFAKYGYYAMMLRAGVDYSEVAGDLNAALAGCGPILTGLGIPNDPSALLYSPIQQSPDDVLTQAQER